jgi:hypothetical protein
MSAEFYAAALSQPVFSTSSASANICNVGLMRHNELSEGIDVLDGNGNVVGSSKIAAKHVSGWPSELTLACIKTLFPPGHEM